MEPGALQQNARGVRSDRGVGPAHHARDRHGLSTGGDEEVVRVQRAHGIVQRDELTPALRPPHYDLSLRQAVQIEGVQRLSSLDHDVVGDVDDVIDRAQADGVQAVLHPVRRWADANLRHHPSCIAPAQIRIGNAHGDLLGAGSALLPHVARRRDSFAPVSAAISRATPRMLSQSPRFGVRASSSTVSVDLQCIGEGCTHHGRGRENHDTGRVVSQIQLRCRAQHALGANAPDLGSADLPTVGNSGTDRRQRDVVSRPHVPGTANHGASRVRSGADLAHHQPLRLRVGIDARDLADDHAVEIAPALLDGLDLEAGSGQPLRYRRRR